MKKILLTLCGVLLVANPAPLQAVILLNEIHLNPPNPDDNYEFIELKSTTNGVEALTGYSLVIINNDKYDEDTLPATLQNIGEIAEVYDLGELSTGANGLLLLGNGYTGSPRGGPWSGFVDPATAVADPAGMGNSDIGSNDGLTILLVTGFTGLKGQDLDANNDQVLDSTPWALIVDSIGTRDRDTTAPGQTNPYVPNATFPSGANIYVTWIGSSLGARDPDTFARHLTTNTPSSALAWYGGKLTGTSSTTVTYQTTRIFGPGTPAMLGEVTPGRPNLAASLPSTSFRINEIGLNPVGDNDRFQYIEIINTNGAARSLAGYWLILLDSYDGSVGNDESPGGGKIVEKWDLTGMATGTNGLLLIGNDISSSYNPFNDLASPLTGFGEPVVTEDEEDPPNILSTGFGEGDVRYKNGLTMLLVQNFIAPVNDDLDAGDDGTADIPLTNLGIIVDQVGFNQINKTGVLGATYSSVNLRTMMAPEMAPDNLSRKAGNFAVDANAWYGGEFDNGSPGFNVSFNRMQVVPTVGAPYNPWFGGFRGAGTPGLPNLTAAINPASPPVAAEIRINEVMIDPTDTEVGDDDTNEYIELISTSNGMAYLEGVWVLVVDMSGNIGDIVQSFPLDGSMTGLNGIAIIGDNYDAGGSYPYLVADGTLTPFAAGIDPVVAIGGNDLPNDGMGIIVLRGPKIGGASPLALSADGLTLSGDLDPTNAGVLTAPNIIADAVMDSIIVAADNPGAGYGWINLTTPFKPHHVARYPSAMTANNGASYYYGKITQLANVIPSLDYTDVWAGTFKGAGSPGRPNHSAPTAPTAVTNVVINEVHVNPPGADNNFEYVEIADAQFRKRSLNGYYLVMFDNVVKNTGSISHFWSLDGMATGENGLLLLGNRYPLGIPNNPNDPNNPWATLVRPQTRLGDPAGREGLSSSLSNGSFGDETGNLNVAFLLVRGFNKAIGFDTDAKVGAGGAGAEDSDGDGQFDSVAWTGGLASGIHDSIMFRDYVRITPDPVTPPPAYPYDGFTYGLADLTSAFLSNPPDSPINPYYHPESFSRFYGEMTPNSVAAWYGGDLDGGPTGNSGSGVAYIANDPTHPPFPPGFTGRATPGQPNLVRNATSDLPDGDGISTFLELAFNSDPNARDTVSPLPVVGVVNVGGDDYAAITFRRLKGGTFADGAYGADGYTYTVQSSINLTAWEPGSTILLAGTPYPNPDGVTETVTYRLANPVTSSEGRAFLRLRIGRQ